MHALTVLRLRKRVEIGMPISQEEANVLSRQGLVTQLERGDAILTFEGKRFLEWQRKTSMQLTD